MRCSAMRTQGFSKDQNNLSASFTHRCQVPVSSHLDNTSRMLAEGSEAKASVPLTPKAPHWKHRAMPCLCLQEISRDTAPAQKVSGKTAFQRNSPIQQNLNKVSQFCPGSHETCTGLQTSETCWVSCLVTHLVPPPFSFPGPWGSLLPNRLLSKRGFHCSHTSQFEVSQTLDHLRQEISEHPQMENPWNPVERLRDPWISSWDNPQCKLLHYSLLQDLYLVVFCSTLLISSKLNLYPNYNLLFKPLPSRHPLRTANFPLNSSLCTSVQFQLLSGQGQRVVHPVQPTRNIAGIYKSAKSKLSALEDRWYEQSYSPMSSLWEENEVKSLYLSI